MLSVMSEICLHVRSNASMRSHKRKEHRQSLSRDGFPFPHGVWVYLQVRAQEGYLAWNYLGRSGRDYHTRTTRRNIRLVAAIFLHPVDYFTWEIIGTFIEFPRKNDIVVFTLSRQACKTGGW
ncbi:hypothetical protein BKA56DRAFT_591143 [Ilyonectria sp. MPI-CAGE-AT-0026]|nr:hypothetical protein BKA56DRAFT_591143 [Ilyonectria sp. MPI-CAGE-AT-0026]